VPQKTFLYSFLLKKYAIGGFLNEGEIVALFLVLGIVMSGCVKEKSSIQTFAKTDYAEEKTVGPGGRKSVFPGVSCIC